MRALDRKVVRDLWHLRGQVIAIALVIASGVAVLIMALSTLEALRETSAAYYERYRFAEVFASVKRAPQTLAGRIETIPGVQTVQTRVVRFATLDMPGFAEPVMAKLVSLPPGGQPVLNQLVLRSGRFPDPGRHDEAVLTEPFAEAHSLIAGDEFIAVLNGNRRRLTVVGTALAPEFIYSIGPGALMPDDSRFGVLWMGREALAAAFDLRESFNDVALELNRGVAPEPVIRQLDDLLERYGGTGAIARKDQLSNWFVMNEIQQQASMSRLLPTIFLVVAAFLTNMVLSRLIATERSQIGLMKAFGYSTFEVGWHYVKLVFGITLLGIVIGIALGLWFGRINTNLYATQFDFPLLIYRPSTQALAIAVGASLVAAMSGAMGSVRRAARLPPAQAMQPPSPPVFKHSKLARSAIGQWLDQPTRIILRHVRRWPVRAALSCFGLASAVAVQVLSLQWRDSLDYLSQSYFFDAQRQHAMIGLAEAQAIRALHEFEHMPGVLAAEPSRIVSADFSVGNITHRGGLTGVVSGAELQPIFDDQRHATIEPPAEGLVLGTRLAEKLRVGVGDRVWVKVLEGRRPEVQVPVADLIETYIGMPAYMHFDALNRLLREPPRFGYVNLLIDRQREAELFAEWKELPMVSAVMLRQAAIDSFNSVVVKNLMVFVTMFTVLACALGFGVAYNATRIALSERGRELATLRVLGFRRGEISYILLGETGLLIVLALPLGCLLGYGLASMMASAFDTELFRIPLTITPGTYGLSMLIILAASLLSAAIVRRRIDHLDLIEVLKTRE